MSDDYHEYTVMHFYYLEALKKQHFHCEKKSFLVKTSDAEQLIRTAVLSFIAMPPTHHIAVCTEALYNRSTTHADRQQVR